MLTYVVRWFERMTYSQNFLSAMIKVSNNFIYLSNEPQKKT